MPRYRRVKLLLVVRLIVPALAGAQTPWIVTLTPTVNPLPIGTCGPVWVKVVDPATQDAPRNPSGGMVTIADFDLTVSHGGTSVTGQYTDASHWAACGCQGASSGTVATITAKYPGALLSARIRVPKVAFETTATIELTAARSSWDPPSCVAAKRAAATPVPAPPAAATATTVAPPAPVPLTGAPPSGTRTSVPVAAPPPGPAPQDIRVGGNPAETSVFWNFPSTSPSPVKYVVERWKTSDPACCRAISPDLTSGSWRDPLMWPGSWTYQVTAIYADGRRGSATATYNYPEPEIPQGFKAIQVARDTVVLSWQPVRGASSYAVGGPPSNIAVRVDSTTTTLTVGGLPLGKATWQVAAMYRGTVAGSPQQGSAFATTSHTVVNPNYRLVAEAIRVTTETADAPLSEDGKYDEVYVASFTELLLRATDGSGKSQALISRQPIRLSAVHGDITGLLPLDRTQAGSASQNGGIRAGDVVIPIVAQPTAASLAKVQFVLWEGQLLPGKHDLILRPMLVEVDEPTYALARVLPDPDPRVVCRGVPCGWGYYMWGPAGADLAFKPGPQAAVAGSQIAIVEGDLVWLGGNSQLVHLENQDRDRPIGLARRNMVDDGMGLTGSWYDKMVILSSEKIEAALAAGRNRIEVRFWDHWNLPNTPQSTISYLNGDYTLVIRIERMP